MTKALMFYNPGHMVMWFWRGAGESREEREVVVTAAVERVCSTFLFWCVLTYSMCGPTPHSLHGKSHGHC